MEAVHACIDRELPPDKLIEAAIYAVRENPANAPVEPSAREIMPGVMLNQIQVAALTGKLWKPGRTLRVRFLDGDPRVTNRCITHAREWEKYANIKFDFSDDPNAEIRVSFKYRGSWSFVGTDALAVEPNEPTLNFGWLDNDTPQDEYARVVTHEFGHALALIHEHQNPSANIPWNKEAVYTYYQAAPNYWTREQVNINIFTRYSADVTRFSAYDRDSIMLYPIPAQFVTDARYSVGWNKVPSVTDRTYVGILYPFEIKPAQDLVIGGGRVQSQIGEMGQTHTYQFNVRDAGIYRVETFGRLDTVVSLFGPNSETVMVAKDDDSGRGLNSRIISQLAPGRYLVRLRHFSARQAGVYEIAVNRDQEATVVARFG